MLIILKEGNFMKKKNILIIVIAIIIIIFGYFATQKFEFIRTKLYDKTIDEESTKNGTLFDKEFGSYELPENWIESKIHSTKEKFFYVLKGQEYEKQPNNISINAGKNKYTKAEHEIFRKAILNQLLLQIGNREDVEINANGSTTNTGEIVYTFTTKQNYVTTKQYYIVGDYKYILIQETLFEESEETEKATNNIINSFIWKE